MKNAFLKNIVIWMVLAITGVSFSPSIYALEMMDPTQIKTGQLEISDFKYTVHMYVPETYTPGQAYPLLALIEGSKSAKELVEAWAGFAKRKGMIVFATDLDVAQVRDVPLNADQFLFSVIEEIGKRYRISKERTYLIGQNIGAHYASYVGVNHPQHFAGVALLDGSWVGALDKALQITHQSNKQIPFFVSYHKALGKDAIAAAEAKAVLLTQKGYPVYFEKVEDVTDFSSLDFRKRVITWLDEKSENWARVAKQSKKSPKQAIKDWFHEFVTIKN